MENTATLVNYLYDFKEWLMSQLLIEYYSDEEYNATIFIQRRFRGKLYNRRCKTTQTDDVIVEETPVIIENAHSSWFLLN